MKRFLLLALGSCLALSACLPGILPSAPSPAPEVDLMGTADALVQQTLQAQPQPSPTLVASETPVVVEPTATETQVPPTPTPTENIVAPTLTATLGTDTPTTSPAALTSSPTSTPSSAAGATPTETLHPRFYGTVPPQGPSGTVILVNKSKAEAYVSLQCTDKNGNVTILEYPVGNSADVDAPAGTYVFVAWVVGNKMTGGFGLGNGDEVTLKLFKDRVVVTSK
jgi:hypothetical protein